MSTIESELLHLIEKGHLHVCHQTLEVHRWHGGFRKFVLKKPDQHPVSGRWRFRFGGKESRKTVYRNRLVWMYFNRRLIPDGYVVDHKDRDNENDHPSNLQLMTRSESHRQGNEVQCDNVLQELSDYFLLCGFLGYDPEE